MLVYTFCAPPSAIKSSSGAKKIYSTKLEIFFFHFSKIEGLSQQSLSYEKTDVWWFAPQRHPLVFYKRGCLNFRAPTHYQHFKRIVLVKIFGNFPVKHSFWSPLFTHICRPSQCAKGHLPTKVLIHFRCAKESFLLSGL